MRTQVAIIGAGPSGLLLSQIPAQCGHRQRHSRAQFARLRSGPHSRRRSGAGSRRHAGCAAGVGARMHREGLVHDGTELCFNGTRHRIDFKELTGKTVMVYGQTEVTRDLVDARRAADARLVYEAEDVELHDFDTTKPWVTYRKDGVEHRIDCDFIAGCDGYHGGVQGKRAAERAEDLRARLSVRLAGHPVGDAAGLRGTHLCPPRARLRAVFHALARAVALLRAGAARRQGGGLVGRALLGGAAPPHRPEGRPTPSSWGRRSRRPSPPCAASSPSR